MTQRFLACCALVLLLGACSSNKSETSTTSTSNPESMSTEAGTMAPNGMAAQSISFVLKPQNGSGEMGTVTLTPMGTQTRVVIGIKGENATGKQPAHVHLGTCAHLNPAPKYPLKDVVLGKSNTVIDASLDDLQATPMAVNIHESAANLKKYVACGNIPAK